MLDDRTRNDGIERRKIVENFKQELFYHQTEQRQTKRMLRKLRTENNKKEQHIVDLSKAIEILNHVAEQTQQKLQYGITGLLNSAIDSIFEEEDETPQVSLEFTKRRGKMECDIFLLDKKGHKINPVDGHGGGLVDVLALALQICLWKIKRPQTRNLLILDEPLKHLKGGNLPKKGAALIKELSHRLNLQVVMISHSAELIEKADRVFEVKKNDGISFVTIRKEKRNG